MAYLDNIAYTFYIKYCRQHGYGMMNHEYFIKNKDNNLSFYKEAIVAQRNIKINKILKNE